MPDGLVERKLAILTNWIAAGLVFILIFTVTMTGVMLWFATTIGGQSADLREVAVQTHTALCALKTDIEDRVEETDDLLLSFPGDVFGIPRELIERGQNDRRTTLAALRIIDCA